MVHLDTNFLILALVPGSPQDARLRAWIAAGESIGLSSIALAEFLSGPVTAEQVKLSCTFFPEPQDFTAQHASRAAELFNQTGRRRGSLLDCMIASSAMLAGASLATENLDDFRRFEPFGLVIA